MPKSDQMIMWGVLAGVGVAVAVGGLAIAANEHQNKKKRQRELQEQRARLGQHVPSTIVVSPTVAGRGGPSRVVGRPFSDPFHVDTSRTSLWGLGPWAHRTPRLTPRMPHF